MKILFASDIHGSLYYCKQIIDAFINEKADKLVLLGDLLYHGPRNPLPKEYAPDKVFTLLNEYKDKIIAVKGNCDSEVDQMVLDFPIENQNISLSLAEKTVFLSHGHKFNRENPPHLQKGDVLINGHFHESEIDTSGEFVYMNPGSVSLPKDGFHGYILYNDGVFTLKSFSGEVKTTYSFV